MGSVLVRETVRKVSVLMSDSSPQFRRYPESEIIDFANEALRIIFKLLPAACASVLSVKLRPGALQSIEKIAAADCKTEAGATPGADITGSLLLDVLCHMGSNGTTLGRALRGIPDGRQGLDAIDPLWMTKPASTPKGYVFDPRMPRHFLVVPPAPSDTAVWVRLSMIAAPAPIPNTGSPGSEVYASGGASVATLPVHDEHEDDIVNYVCARLLMKNAKASSANGMTWRGFADLFVSSINAKAQVIMGYNPNLKELPFAPQPIGAAG